MVGVRKWTDDEIFFVLPLRRQRYTYDEILVKYEERFPEYVGEDRARKEGLRHVWTTYGKHPFYTQHDCWTPDEIAFTLARRRLSSQDPSITDASIVRDLELNFPEKRWPANVARERCIDFVWVQYDTLGDLAHEAGGENVLIRRRQTRDLQPGPLESSANARGCKSSNSRKRKSNDASALDDEAYEEGLEVSKPRKRKTLATKGEFRPPRTSSLAPSTIPPAAIQEWELTEEQKDGCDRIAREWVADPSFDPEALDAIMEEQDAQRSAQMQPFGTLPFSSGRLASNARYNAVRNTLPHEHSVDQRFGIRAAPVSPRSATLQASSRLHATTLTPAQRRHATAYNTAHRGLYMHSGRPGPIGPAEEPMSFLPADSVVYSSIHSNKPISTWNQEMHNGDAHARTQLPRNLAPTGSQNVARQPPTSFRSGLHAPAQHFTNAYPANFQTPTLPTGLHGHHNLTQVQHGHDLTTSRYPPLPDETPEETQQAIVPPLSPGFQGLLDELRAELHPTMDHQECGGCDDCTPAAMNVYGISYQHPVIDPQVLEDSRRQEDARFFEMARLREEANLIEEARLREEASLIEEARLREEANLIVEARLREEANLIEEARLREEANLTEEARLGEEAHLIEEARLREEARVFEEARLSKETSLREEANLAEEARMFEEAIWAEEARMMEAQRQDQVPLLEAQLRIGARLLAEEHFLHEHRRQQELRPGIHTAPSVGPLLVQQLPYAVYQQVLNQELSQSSRIAPASNADHGTPTPSMILEPVAFDPFAYSPERRSANLSPASDVYIPPRSLYLAASERDRAIANGSPIHEDMTQTIFGSNEPDCFSSARTRRHYLMAMSGCGTPGQAVGDSSEVQAVYQAAQRATPTPALAPAPAP